MISKMNNKNMRPTPTDEVLTSFSVNICSRKLSFCLHFSADKYLLNSLNAKLTPYRNQSIDFQSKSIDWFLYDGNFGV